MSIDIQSILTKVRNQVANYKLFVMIKRFSLFIEVKPKLSLAKYEGFNFDKNKFGTKQDTIKWSQEGNYWLPIKNAADVRIIIEVPYGKLKEYGKI